MLNRHAEPMNVEAFFAWQERQAERYELVDGCPLRRMAGARDVHDDIVVNLVAELRNTLRGSGCRPFTGDGSVDDAFEKLDEYRGVASLRHILLIEPNAPEILHWARAEDGAWSRARIDGLDAAVSLPALGLSLAISDIYEGVGFPPRPRLVPTLDSDAASNPAT